VDNFYLLLSVERSASQDQIKKAFRAEIARYHPDKVHHLGKEFQEIAATRAAQLTEAYRTLTNPELREEYDRRFLAGAPRVAAPVVSTAPAAATRQEPSPAPPPPAPDASAGPNAPSRFAWEHGLRDNVVKKATIERIREVVLNMTGATELPPSGFTLSFSIRVRNMFGQGVAQRVAFILVPAVDTGAIRDAWIAAQRAGGHLCLLVMGSELGSPRDLGHALTEMKRKSRSERNVWLVPVNFRDWSAHMPVGAPALCRDVLKRLREDAGSLT
jgi:hypothetical protein